MNFMRAASGADPALDAAVSAALLQAVARDGEPATLRIYRPLRTVAFGRLDAHAPGFAAAAAAARAAGFTPILRAPGGRAAAYHEDCLILDAIMPDTDAIAGTQARFAAAAGLLAAALRRLGVDARVGEVPGEYCPGRFTVNARGRVKLVGTAQRVIRGGALLSAVVVCARADPLRDVLTDVYRALDFTFDPATAGAIADEAPAVGVDDVEHAILAEYATRNELTETAPSAALLERARASVGDNRIGT